MANKVITASADGLGTRGVFLSYSVNRVYFTSTNWTGQTLQFWTAPADVAADYVAERVDTSADTAYSTSSNGSIMIEGPCWLRPYLSGTAGGVEITVMDPFNNA